VPTIVLGEKLYEKLLREAKVRDVAVEELVIEVLARHLNVVLDSQDRVELHLRLCEKYLEEAEELLAREDYPQASEKMWGAASQMVKAIATKEGVELRSHRDLWAYIDELSEKLSDREIRLLWRTANSLHQNFYENWMPPRDVKYAFEDVKRLIEKLRRFLRA